ncbi:MAG: hypothetical protein II957_07180 [Treponema sp.]|nr:hypothetical protein [Treponema sp.]
MKLVKRVLFCAATVYATAICLSCEKNQEIQQKAQEEEHELRILSANSSAPLPPLYSEEFFKAVILVRQAELCIPGRDKKMHSVKKIYAPSETDAVQLDLVYKNGRPETKLVKGEDKATAYFHAVYDNVDYWVLKDSAALNSESAVITESTALYKDNSLKNRIAEKGASLSFGTVVAKPLVQEETDSPAEKIFYYNKQLACVQEAYVKKGSASKANDDIAVLKIVEELKKTQRAVARNNLFARAAKYKPSPAVKAALEAQKVERISYDYQEVLESITKMNQKKSYGINVNELMTVDQSKDPFGN